jgi:hypothetical protein
VRRETDVAMSGFVVTVMRDVELSNVTTPNDTTTEQPTNL